MKNYLIFFLLLMLVISSACQRKGSFTTTPAGIEVVTADGVTVRVDVISESLLHVRATVASQFSTDTSLVVVRGANPDIAWKAIEANGSVILSTSEVSASIVINTGAITFLDADGNVIINEPEDGGRTFEPMTVDGVNGFVVRQVWESSDYEAIYGLGQHQAHIMNYKGRDEELFQYNTKVSIPFIISTNNYGILWDNYSLSRFGDPLPYTGLDKFILYNSRGESGGLTATYIDNVETGNVFLVREETLIDYENLETVENFPEGLNFYNARVTWEGYLEPRESGLFNFQLYYGGYTKLWIDGELMADRWRTSWNPSVARFPFEMTKGQRYRVVLEWYPDGGVSYVGLRARSPRTVEDRNNLSFFSEMGDEISYYFMKGNSMDDVIGNYRYLTGKAQIKPKWSLGFWQSRERYRTQEELLNVVKEFRRRGIPLDNIVMDWQFWEEDQWGSHVFDSARFPDPAVMVRTIHENNARIMISVWPKFYVGTEHFEQFNRQGWMYRRAVEDSIRDWVGPGYVGSFYDAFNPAARELYWQQIRDNLHTLGIDAWWLDATEPDILSNASIEYRKALMNPTFLGTATKFFNAYSLVNAKGVYEGLRELEPNERVFILTRSGFTGMQRYGTVTWSGDVGSVWEDMKAQIPAGVNFSMSGLPFWTMDIGGFCVENRFEEAAEGSEDLAEWRELQTRWFQFGAFVPIFRVHGQYPFREIWYIAPEGHPAYKSMVYYNKLRYRLMPYIYSLAGAVYHNNYTIMRGLAMDFPNDRTVFNIDDQYMFGPAFMVCPVVEYRARQREVYFPQGTGWYCFNTGKFYQGGTTQIVEAPYERMPLFVPEGSIIPFGPAIEHTAKRFNAPITLKVYAGKDGEFVLYEDEGTNYNYQKGYFSKITINYNDANRTLTIGNREGAFDGMFEKRQFRVMLISQENPAGYDPLALEAGKLHDYDGNEIVIKL